MRTTAALGVAGLAAALCGTACAPAGHPAVAARAAAQAHSRSAPVTAYVVNQAAGTVIPIRVSGNRPGRPVRVGCCSEGLAFTPDGRRVFVSSLTGGTLTVIDGVTGRCQKVIKAGEYPGPIAVTPDGRTSYVDDGGTIRTVSTATGAVGKPIRIDPAGGLEIMMDARFPTIAVTPDGTTAYALSSVADAVVPIDTATGQAGAPVPVGGSPDSLAITPDGRTVYVASAKGVIPIATATNRGARPSGFPTAGAGTTS
jgi:YVTN family beta-propeller protein